MIAFILDDAIRTWVDHKEGCGEVFVAFFFFSISPYTLSWVFSSSKAVGVTVVVVSLDEIQLVQKLRIWSVVAVTAQRPFAILIVWSIVCKSE